MATIAQINVSPGGVPKTAVPSGVVGLRGLENDHQADPVHHGSPDQALCLYSTEVISALQDEGHPIFPGATGENVTIVGLDWSALEVGQRIGLGDQVQIELTGYASPCKNNEAWFADGKFGRMSQKRHPGWSRMYAKVVQTGEIAVGDHVELLGEAPA